MKTYNRFVPIVRLAVLAACTTLLVGSVAIASPTTNEAKSPTFYEDVLPILQQNCQNCHREGGANYGGMVAPMALLTYDQVRPWSRSIARHAQARTMPPWHASPDQAGLFSNERGLSNEQISTLVEWASGGAREGDARQAPPEVTWPKLEGWSIGEPDLVLQLPERYFVTDDAEDEYKYFRHTLTGDQLPEDRWIQAFEFRPGSSAVHHIILLPIGGIAPGTDATRYADGIGRRLRAGTELVWQMHYHKEPGPGTGVWDRSEVAIKFYPEDRTVEFPIRDAEMGNYGFAIPPGAADYSVATSHRFSKDSQIVSFAPHMHLRGKSAHYEAIFPDGRRETLLDVPNYDFNWQTTYTYREPLFVPEGTQVVVTTTWDNSSDNPNNPDPTKTVRYGEPTTDEMSFGYLEYIDAKDHGGGSVQATRASTQSSSVWRSAKHGFSFAIPEGMVEDPSADALAGWSSTELIPAVQIDAEASPFALSPSEWGQAMVAELGVSSGASVVRSEQVTLDSGSTVAEIVIEWSYEGFPLTSLVWGAHHEGSLISVFVSHLRGTDLEILRSLAEGLKLETSDRPEA